MTCKFDGIEVGELVSYPGHIYCYSCGYDWVDRISGKFQGHSFMFGDLRDIIGDSPTSCPSCGMKKENIASLCVRGGLALFNHAIKRENELKQEVLDETI